jgi:hypothetical protein
VDAVRGLDLATYGVVAIDSITHLWESCKNAFTGRTTKAGTIPFHAWAAIKKPYRELMHQLLTLPVHVLITGRQGVDYAEDESSGELKALGYKMRAEGETAYEPDVLLRLEAHKAGKKAPAVPVAHVEKDRSGVLAGRTIGWPTFANVAQPLLGLLGTTHAAVPSDDEVGRHDAEALERQEMARGERSQEVAEEFQERFGQAEGAGELQRIAAEMTAEVKGLLLPKDLERTRRAYAARLARLKRAPTHEGDPETVGPVPAANGAV